MKLESYYKSKKEKTWCEHEAGQFTCATSLVESVMKANAEYPHSDIEEFAPFTVRNGYQDICQECGAVDEVEYNERCSVCKSEDVSLEPVEILEWWIVDPWMARHLEDIGEPVLEACNLHFWGRTTSGQAIVLDGVLQKIYRSIK